MQRGDLRRQHFAACHQVVQVGLRIERVDERRALGVDRREVVLPFLVADVDDAFGRE